ncbi:ovoinhibitor-like isoform X2 [Ctenocephalides felis]|uniref:ovoinhibitor-like isoform X2 n=1 Tax=Ctenocephalides felis TaxID=7515 RepID=UPI000E6E3F87|nr:ovoinhibitor-like isoform X2 [Ctenocephalides felis]
MAFLRIAAVLCLAFAASFAEDLACPGICTDDYRPVCATAPGERLITFSNECEMRNFNCHQKKSLKKLSDGKCPQMTRETEKCTSFCTFDYRPVCAAADGEIKTFANECILKNYNCQERKSLKKVSDGECPKITREAENDCNSFCTLEFNPVCTQQNGEFRTFANECVLRTFNCQKRQSFKVVSSGVCPEIKRKSEQKCLSFCTFDYRPVCAGESGELRTFANECDLRNYNCQQRKSLKKISDGECPQITRSDKACKGYCPKIYSPVCAGMNGEFRTFDNECILQNYNCEHHLSLQKVSEGVCPKILRTKENCQLFCTLEYKPVCAAAFNGEIRTFANECVLRSYNCQQRKSLKKISEGECPQITRNGKNCNLKCTKEYRPVCAGVNGEVKTFGNECVLQSYNCVNNKSLQKISDGECPKIVRSKENCPTMCTLDYRPVCAAANGEVRTFANECDLRVYNCKQHKALQILSEGECPQLTRF